jgi:hypothetical protein
MQMTDLDRQELDVLRDIRMVHNRILKNRDRMDRQRIREEVGDFIPIEEYIKPVTFGDYLCDERKRLERLELLLENISLKRQLGEADAGANASK